MTDRLTVGSALSEVTERLARAGCESPRLDAEILLAEAMGIGRARLLAHDGDPLPVDIYDRFAAWVARREKREPMAYITGHREFYGLDFAVTPAVLIPRPETEHAVEEALALARERDAEGAGVVIADVGTGSGAIAVSLAANLLGAEIYALDSSADALAVARTNVQGHGVADRVHLIHSDLLASLPQPVDLIVANLPYVTDAEWEELAPEIRWYEPETALRGGTDGLDAIRRLLDQAAAHMRLGGAVILEIGASQAAEVRELALNAFPRAAIRITKDYAGLDRVIVVRPADGKQPHRRGR